MIVGITLCLALCMGSAANTRPRPVIILFEPEGDQGAALKEIIRAVWEEELAELDVLIRWDRIDLKKQSRIASASQHFRDKATLAVIWYDSKDDRIHVVYSSQGEGIEEIVRDVGAVKPGSIAEASGIIIREQVSALLGVPTTQRHSEDRGGDLTDGIGRKQIQTSLPASVATFDGDDNTSSGTTADAEGTEVVDSESSAVEKKREEKEDRPSAQPDNTQRAINIEISRVSLLSGARYGPHRWLRFSSLVALNFFSKETPPLFGGGASVGIHLHPLLWGMLGYCFFQPVTVQEDLTGNTVGNAEPIHGKLTIIRHAITLGFLALYEWGRFGLRGMVGVAVSIHGIRSESDAEPFDAAGDGRDVQTSIPIRVGVSLRAGNRTRFSLDGQVSPIVDLPHYSIDYRNDKIPFFTPYRVQSTITFGVSADFF